MVDSQWLYCGECTEDTLVTDNKITTSTDEVSKQTSVESSGDYNDDTETSLETEEDNIYDTEPYTGTTGKPTEFDEQLDVAKITKKQSLFCLDVLVLIKLKYRLRAFNVNY